MASIARLIGRPIGYQLLNYEKSILLFARPVTMQTKKAPKKPMKINYDEKNMRLGRPYSPHLTIYAPQLTTLLSITHRGTGFILSYCVMLFGLGTYLPNDGLLYLIDFVHDNGILLFITKFGLSFTLAYHFYNGIRHLFWDMGKFLTLKEVYSTGYAVVALAGITGAILPFI